MCSSQCASCSPRARRTRRDTPAPLRFTALPEGRREAKFERLGKLSLGGPEWGEGPSGWREPFLPDQEGAWASFPALEKLFVYDGSGVMPGRTWIIAPDPDSLRERWGKLVLQKDPAKREMLFHPHEGGDRTSTKSATKGLTGHEIRLEPVSVDVRPVIEPVKYAFRTLDRQWIIPDNRLINPTLWDTNSDKQVYLTALERAPVTSGPAVSSTCLIPDLDHYHGRGGRVFPLWRDAAATVPNVKPALLAHLAAVLGKAVAPEDVMATLPP